MRRLIAVVCTYSAGKLSRKQSCQPLQFRLSWTFIIVIYVL